MRKNFKKEAFEGRAALQEKIEILKPRPIVETYLYTDPKHCTQCPMSLVCLADRRLGNNDNIGQVFTYSMVCSRCLCVVFSGNNEYHLCALLRMGYWPRIKVKRKEEVLAANYLRGALRNSLEYYANPGWGCASYCERAEIGDWGQDHPIHYAALSTDPEQNTSERLLQRANSSPATRYSPKGNLGLRKARVNTRRTTLSVDDCVTFLQKGGWPEVHEL